MGPLIVDLESFALTAEERDLLQHPSISGVILFTRNYESPEQLIELCKSIRVIRPTSFLITVDQEGGRVQRFRQGFTRLPNMGSFGTLFEKNPERAKSLTAICGWMMAMELLAVGIDLSFAPVLDLDKKNNPVVGDRAFHHDIAIINTLAECFFKHMNQAGMAATGKHFPGHGSVTIDSHVGLPTDTRDFAMIQQNDMSVFATQIKQGIQAIMAAHIIFPKVDAQPASFSATWLKSILRQQLHFSGMIFSDDLTMKALDHIGDFADRATYALQAGCDMILVCNHRAGVIQILDRADLSNFSVDPKKLKTLQGKFSTDWKTLMASSQWRERYNQLQHFINEVYAT